MERALEEEVVNAYTHLLAAALSFLASIVLSIKAPNNTAMLQMLILGLCSTWTFFSSFLYHASTREKIKERNRILDKASIYLMIAGSGIAISLSNLDKAISVSCCIAVLFISCCLILSYCLEKEENESYSIVSYLLLGWLSIMSGTGFVGESALANSAGIFWLVACGCLYSVGVLFFIRDSKKWYHTAWHIFVMLGYSAHVIAHAVANQML